jgi:hypothetical protein
VNTHDREVMTTINFVHKAFHMKTVVTYSTNQSILQKMGSILYMCREFMKHLNNTETKIVTFGLMIQDPFLGWLIVHKKKKKR